MRGRLAVAMLTVSLAACGIPIDAAPETIVIELGEPPVIEPPRADDLTTVSLYLVEAGRIIPVTRDLPEPATLEEIMAALLDGTTGPESRAGLRTSIPSGTTLIGVRRSGPNALIDLSREFADVGGEEEILAVAQVVLTATSVQGVETVSFALEGVPTDVPLANGALSDQPVRAADYQALVSP